MSVIFFVKEKSHTVYIFYKGKTPLNQFYKFEDKKKKEINCSSTLGEGVKPPAYEIKTIQPQKLFQSIFWTKQT